MSRKLRVTVTIAVLALIAAVATTAGAQQDFSFTTPNDQTITLGGLRGNVVVLMFSGTQDPQCRDELKALEQMAGRFQGKDVRFFWVSVNPVTEVPNAQLKNPCGVATSIPVLRDGSQTAFKRFSGRRAQLPTVVVLDRQGNPSGSPRAGINPNSDFVNDLASTIDLLLQRK